MKVQVIGLGYIGLPTAALIASNKIKVIGVDIKKDLIDFINKGLVDSSEKELPDLIKKSIQNGYFKATLSTEKADVHLIAVPTPFKEYFKPDISYLERAIENIIPLLYDDNLIVIESTSPVGTTQKLSDKIFQKRPELKYKIHIAYCPERVIPGNILYELIHNDRIVGGINKSSSYKAKEFYSIFTKGNIYITDSKTSELCKLVENASRDVQIAFANELSLICDKLQIDVYQLIELANKHPRVNILQPGIGVGGHCLAVDPYFLVTEFPEETKIIKVAREVNNYKAYWVAQKILQVIQEFEVEYQKKPKVAFFGLAYKPNVSDLRESPAKYIVQKVMQSINDEDVFIVEPNIKKHNIFVLTSINTAIKKADIIVFLVAHKEFENISFSSLTSKKILNFCKINLI